MIARIQMGIFKLSLRIAAACLGVALFGAPILSCQAGRPAIVAAPGFDVMEKSIPDLQ